VLQEPDQKIYKSDVGSYKNLQVKYDLLPAYPVLQQQQSADSSLKKHAIGLKSLQIVPNKLSSTASSEEEKKDEKTYSPF